MKPINSAALEGEIPSPSTWLTCLEQYNLFS